MPRETLNLPLIGTDAGVLLQIIPHLRHSLLLLSFARPTCANPVNAPFPDRAENEELRRTVKQTRISRVTQRFWLVSSRRFAPGICIQSLGAVCPGKSLPPDVNR